MLLDAKIRWKHANLWLHKSCRAAKQSLWVLKKSKQREIQAQKHLFRHFTQSYLETDGDRHVKASFGCDQQGKLLHTYFNLTNTTKVITSHICETEINTMEIMGMTKSTSMDPEEVASLSDSSSQQTKGGYYTFTHSYFRHFLHLTTCLFNREFKILHYYLACQFTS